MKRMLKKLKPLVAAVLAVNMMLTPIASFAEQGSTYESIVEIENEEIEYENDTEGNIEDTDSELEADGSESDDNVATLPSFPDEEITLLPELSQEEAIKIPEIIGTYKLPADVDGAINKAMYYAEYKGAVNSYRNSSNWEMLLDFKLNGIDLNTSPWYADHTWKSVAPTGSSNPSENKPDLYAQNIFRLLANDIDPSNIWGGRNLFNELANLQIIEVTEWWQEVGMLVNGVGLQSYAIIALNTGADLGVDVGPWNIERERLAIELLISWQTSNGNIGSLDETGMALVALANYKNDSEIGNQVQAAINKAVEFINENQLETGGFSSSGNMWDPGENSNSIATAIQGLIAIGENIYADKWIKDGNTMVDALLSFQLEDGSFKWKPGDTAANATAFSQSLAALLDVANNKSMRLELAEHIDLSTSIKIDSVKKIEDNLEVELILGSDKFKDEDDIKKVVEVKLNAPQTETKAVVTGVEIIRMSDTQIKIIIPADNMSNSNNIEISIKTGGTQKNLVITLSFNYVIPQDGKIDIAGEEDVYINDTNQGDLILNFEDTKLPNITVIGEDSSFKIDKGTEITTTDTTASITVPQLIKEETDINTINTHIATSLGNSYTNIDLKSAYYMGDTKTTLNNHFTLSIPNKTRSLSKTFVGYYDGDTLKSVEVKSAPSSGNIYAYEENGNIIVKSNFTTTISVFSATYVPPVNTPKISVTIDATKGNQGSRSYQVDYMPGDTAFDVLKRTGASVDSTGYNESIYVVGINGLNERAHGAGSGWMYSVNGTFPDISSGSYKISAGDRVSWVYTTNLGQDVGANRPGISVIPGVVSQNYTVEDLTKAVELGASWILKNRDFSEYDQFADWDIMVIANSGQAIPQAYYKTLEAEVKSKKGEFRLVSDYERMVLALSSIGKDPRNVAGYDLVEKIYNNEKIESQGTNGIAFALIALDSRNYHVPKDALWSRSKLVDTLIAYQNSDGGFPLAKGSSSDVDVTSMVIQALSNYTNDSKVKKVVENALEYISKTQLKDGGFESSGSRYSETVAQAIIALSAMKISVENPDFTKDFNLLDNLMAFQNEDGGFSHTSGEKSNYIATQQALLALVSLKNLAQSKEYVYKYDQIGEINPKEEEVLPEYIPYSDESSIAPWALASVIKAQQYGIMKGTDLQKNTFDPKKNLTRAEFAAILTNMISTEMAEIKFADVSKNAWYYESISMVVNIGAMTGVSNTEFNPSGLITREQMASAISRMMKVKAQEKIVPQDIEKASLWAKDAIIDVVSAGLITGTDKGFEPKAFVTREMAAAIMVRIFEEK